MLLFVPYPLVKTIKESAYLNFLIILRLSNNLLLSSASMCEHPLISHLKILVGLQVARISIYVTVEMRAMLN